MFTGIVEELGVVAALETRDEGLQLRIDAPKTAGAAELGGSVAVNGCCLTAVARGEGWWEADVVAESLRRTTLGRLQVGDAVNLERPVAAAGLLEGHVVQGHVDGIGRVAAARGADDARRLEVELPESLGDYVVEKGSIALDGVSLTVASITAPGVAPVMLSVAVIPHTATVTTLGRRRAGDEVNIEVDVLAKYVERILAGRRG